MNSLFEGYAHSSWGLHWPIQVSICQLFFVYRKVHHWRERTDHIHQTSQAVLKQQNSKKRHVFNNLVSEQENNNS